MASNVSARVIDNGLAVLDTEPDRLFICSAEPTDYATASGALRLGLKTFAVGTFFGAPQAGTATGRKVSSIAFADGLVTATGTATHWAVCDSVNLRLLATGTLAAPTAVVNTAAFGLPIFSIQVSILIGAAISGVTVTATSLATASPALGLPVINADAVGWKNLKVGAGGFIVGGDMHADGTLVVRADTFGAYIYDRAAVNPGNAGGTGAWKQLVTTSSMPSAIVNIPASSQGSYEIRIAPSNSNIIYMCYANRIFVSTNKGVSFTQTAYSAVALPPNLDPHRIYSHKMAVDPANPNVVYISTVSSGVYMTNGGTTGGAWSLVSGVSANDGNGIGCVAFDHMSGTTGGKTNTVYLAVSGFGVYRSTNAGVSFALMSGTPTQLYNVRISANGTLYGTTGPPHRLWKLSGTTWTDITPSTMADAAQCVVCHPTDAAKIVTLTYGGGGCESSTAGASWTARNGATPTTMIATDCPWLATQNWFGGAIATIWGAWDPIDTTKLWAPANQGVWTTPMPFPTSTPYTWTSVNAGIEQLVANQVLSIPGYAPLCLSWDEGIIRKPVLASYPPALNWDTTTYLNTAFAGDYASSNPSFVCAVVNNQGPEGTAYSTNGGTTWQRFASYPAKQQVGGVIAASTPSNIVWVGSNEGSIYYTTNGGVEWSRATTPGAQAFCDGHFTSNYSSGTTVMVLPDVSGLTAGGYFNTYVAGAHRIASIVGNTVTVDAPGLLGTGVVVGDYYFSNTGWGHAYYNTRRIACADRVTANTFYAYNDDQLGSAAGTWRSTDSGANWARVSTTLLDPVHGNALMRSVPGQAGHLFFSVGGEGNPTDPASSWPHGGKFYYSTNGGTTWSDVGILSGNTFTIREVWSFGFGKAVGSYPVIYIYGFVAAGASPAPPGSLPGYWKSIDQGATWQQFGSQYPIGWPDLVRAVEGDMDVIDRVYVGVGGSGFFYYG